jgi:hypothetical protein
VTGAEHVGVEPQHVLTPSDLERRVVLALVFGPVDWRLLVSSGGVMSGRKDLHDLTGL